MSPRTHRGLIVAFFAYVMALLNVYMPSPAHAEDIDIFRVNPNVSAQRPNVLIMLDTSSNWASTDTVGGGTKFENVRAALVKAIDGFTAPDGKVYPGLKDSGAFNVGLMMYAETGTDNSNIDGGVLRFGMRHLNAANGTVLSSFFQTIDGNFDKSNNTTIGLAFYEAYQYFTNGRPFAGNNKAKSDYTGNTACAASCVLGTTGNQANDNPTLTQSHAVWNMTPPADGSLPRNALDSKTDTSYNGPMTDACQKNYIIYIANGNVTDSAASDHSGSNNARTFLDQVSSLVAGSSVTNNTNDVRITNPTYSADAGTAEDNMSDEWTRWLAGNDIRPDGSNPTFPGRQSIITYTIEVNPVGDNQGRQNTALLWSMAENGGGGRYLPVTSANGGADLAIALNETFNEILAVSSVFASVSLPASVNVRGTFLNQVYMGVFRPDANSSPRWAGNLKQYALGVINAGQTDEAVVLVDKNDSPVEDTSGATGVDKGLVAPGAVSFWTTTSSFWNTTYYPDTKAKPPIPITTSDSPDGQFVEKGGHAQQLRSAFELDVTPRKVYTCVGCANNSNIDLSVSPDPVNPIYEFHQNNGLITGALLGITTPQNVTSLTRNGATVTAVMPANHGFVVGQSVQILGATQTEYNGTTSVASVVNPSTFTYTIAELPITPATASAGSMTAVRSGTNQTINSITRSGTTARVATQGAHSYSVGDTVTIAGTTSTAYQGAFPVTAVIDPQTFEYTVPTTPVTPPTSLSGATAKAGSTTKNIATLTRSGTTVTVTTSGNIFTGASPGTGTVEIANVNPSDYNGTTFSYTKLSNSSFTYTLLSPIGPADENPAPVGASTTLPNASATISSMNRGASVGNVSVVTVVTSAAHAFVTGNSITIAGAAQTQYNGTHTPITVPVPGGTTFTFSLATTPVSPATTATTITAAGAGGIDRTALINWVRGANTQNDDNPDNLATSVRGYLHGDVLHSRPVVVNYNRNDPVDERDIVVYYGANDGMIHAVKGGQTDADGVEKWTFVPNEFYTGFARLFQESPVTTTAVPRTYFADGPVSANLIYVSHPNAVDPSKPIERLSPLGSAQPTAQMFVGMRRGGRFYYALNVIDPDRPVFMWKIDNTMTDFAELGQSWSEAKVAKIKLAPSACPGTEDAQGNCRVLVFGGGYDAAANDPVTQGTATMGRAIFVVDAETGTLIWRAANPSAPAIGTGVNAAATGMNYAIPADLTVIDSDRDVQKLADRIYAADTGGNIWRADISDPNPANWRVGKIAALGGSGANARKFLFAPDVVPLNSTTDSVLIGTGDREQPFETAIANRFYMVKDSHSLVAMPAPADPALTPVTESDLCSLSVASPDASTCLADPSKKGWMFQLETGEKVVTGALTLAGVTVFSTNTPASQQAPGTCTGSLGRALTYAINFDTATPGIDWNGDGVLDTFATEETRGGFLSTAVQFTGTVDGKPVETFIVAPRVYQPGGPSIGQRYRVFWNLSVDN